ncbi:TRAP transporter small permease [Pseudophaeobacter sp. 1A16562]|uniref:TRAP transporter small permease subunit n=1 Tax=unclassified Pseudophaeobacter TaxID=2637024 RepID=UPI0034D6BB8A
MSRHETTNTQTPEAGTSLDRVLKGARRLSRLATWVSGLALVVICFLVMVEVLLRKFFGVTLGGMNEITGYVLAVTVSWTLSFALLEHAHIRIDVLYNIANRRIRALLDLLSLGAMTGFMLLVTYWAGQLLKNSIDFGSRSNSALQVPLWLPQSLWVAGLVFFVLTLLLLCLRSLGYLWRRDTEGISRIAGIKPVDDEVEEHAMLTDLNHARQG